MSALGEYIHLHYKNYQKYGVARTGESPKIANYSLNVIQQRINNVEDISQETIKELQRRLKLNSQSNLEKEKTQQAKIQQQLINEIYSLLYERSRTITGIKRLAQKASGKFTSIIDKKRVFIERESHWGASLDHKELSRRSQQANDLYKKIQKLITQINKKNQSQSIEKIKELQYLYKQYTHLSYDSDEHTLAAIQKAITRHRYNNTKNQVAGDFGEMLVAICDDKIFKEANSTVAEIVEQSVTGKQKAEIIIDKTLISDNRGDYIFKSSTEDGTSYYIKPTQNKIDTQIQINNENILASVKNYSGTEIQNFRPHLQEVNLFYSILFLNSYPGLQDIGNHWLNLHTIHPGRGKIIDKNSQIDNIIKKEVAFQALSSGNPFKQGIDKANVFVYINRDLGKVYVKSVKDILNNFSDFSGLDKISRIFLQNHKMNGIEDRITNVLIQLHQQKVSVSLKVKI